MVPSVSQCLAEINQNLAEVDLPPDNKDLRARVDKLVEQGCDEQFLLEVSFLYAYVAFASKKNSEAEQSTPTMSRLIALPGLNMSRRELANHLRDVRHAARQIERILEVARKPGKDQQTLIDAADLGHLPKELERYCKFAADVGRACEIPREKRLQRDRCLCSLVKYVETITGKHHWETLVALINRWNLVFIEDDVTLRAQFRRANRPGQLPLFWPKTVQKR